jgi:hypothetical protein
MFAALFVFVDEPTFNALSSKTVYRKKIVLNKRITKSIKCVICRNLTQRIALDNLNVYWLLDHLKTLV